MTLQMNEQHKAEAWVAESSPAPCSCLNYCFCIHMLFLRLQQSKHTHTKRPKGCFLPLFLSQEALPCRTLGEGKGRENRAAPGCLVPRCW